MALCICELVALTNLLFAARRADGGITLREAAVLGKNAHEWVVNAFQPVLGPSHTTKLHRLSAHLLDEFRLRGNLSDGNSALNESLHKAVKAAYKGTNKKRGQLIEQLIMNEQVHLQLAEEDRDASDRSEKSGSGGDESSAPVQRTRHAHGRLRRLRRRYSRKQSGSRTAANRNISGLADALGCDGDALLFPRSSIYFGNASLGRTRAHYTIRESPNFHGSPWFDRLRYRGEDGEVLVGQAALAVSNRTGSWERLVVRRAKAAPAQPDCVLTQYGCERLQ